MLVLREPPRKTPKRAPNKLWSGLRLAAMLTRQPCSRTCLRAHHDRACQSTEDHSVTSPTPGLLSLNEARFRGEIRRTPAFIFPSISSSPMHLRFCVAFTAWHCSMYNPAGPCTSACGAHGSLQDTTTNLMHACMTVSIMAAMNRLNTICVLPIDSASMEGPKRLTGLADQSVLS